MKHLSNCRQQGQNVIDSRDRRDQKFRDDTDTDSLRGPESRPILILILWFDSFT